MTVLLQPASKITLGTRKVIYPKYSKHFTFQVKKHYKLIWKLKINRPVHVKTWHLEKSWDLVIYALIFSEFGYVPDFFYVQDFFGKIKFLCSKKHKYFFWHLENRSVFKFLCSKKHKYFFWHLEKLSVFKFLCCKKHKYFFWHLENIEKVWNIAKFWKNQGKYD